MPAEVFVYCLMCLNVYVELASASGAFLTLSLLFQMSFASEKLYNGYLRKNLAIIVSRVNVREIVVHLPCLTLHDRVNVSLCFFFMYNLSILLY